MSDVEKWPEDDIDFDNIITEDAEFIEIYNAFRNGRLEPQKTYLYFNIALEETKEELARNPDSIKVQQRKTEIENYLIKINKILGSTNRPKETKPVIKENLPPVIQDILNSGYFNDNPIEDGKYLKRSGIKDRVIIKWLFDNRPHTALELTADLYLRYILTEVKPQSIGQYISQSAEEMK